MVVRFVVVKLRRNLRIRWRVLRGMIGEGINFIGRMLREVWIEWVER